MIKMNMITTFVEIEINEIFEIILWTKIIDILSKTNSLFPEEQEDYSRWTHFFVAKNNQCTGLISNIDDISIEKHRRILTNEGNQSIGKWRWREKKFTLRFWLRTASWKSFKIFSCEEKCSVSRRTASKCFSLARTTDIFRNKPARWKRYNSWIFGRLTRGGMR